VRERTARKDGTAQWGRAPLKAERQGQRATEGGRQVDSYGGPRPQLPGYHRSFVTKCDDSALCLLNGGDLVKVGLDGIRWYVRCYGPAGLTRFRYDLSVDELELLYRMSDRAEALVLAFDYGRAKGYRLAMREVMKKHKSARDIVSRP